MDAVIGVVVEYTIRPILHQIGYIFCYKGNIKEVENKLEALETTKDSVQILVSQDRGKGNAIFDGVTKWLDSVKEVLDVTQQKEAPNPSCFNLVKRHQLSRKAKKRVGNIVELINEGRQFNKDNVGYPVPSPDTNSPTLPTDYQIIESRTLVVKEIKDALANPNVNKVGVCGMGGVGKTALLNEVKKLVLENNLFDRVIHVEVGQSKSVVNIQEEIRGKLNMELNMQSEDVRASCLKTNIVERKENILFMLDDLWKQYDLEKKFGIPCHSGCKILITSRSQHTLKNQMNTEKLFEVNSLTEEESWKFFVAIVGEFVEDIGYVQQIAKDVVKECGGLPIALKIVAIALKGKRVEIWKDALKKLKNPVIVDIHGISDQLYSCLQLSYDSIEDEAKLILLLCSVFPDDHKIDVKDLQMYAMGMRLLNHINTWEDARNRVIKLVDDLKSSYLLLESDKGDDKYVKMHDVVHDFAKYFASKIEKMVSLTYGSGQREWLEDDRRGPYNAIYVDCKDFPWSLPLELEFPNLQLLILENYITNNQRNIRVGFFEGMKELRVLEVRCMYFDPPMTSIVHSLKNLQILCLSRCGRIDIDTISQLKKLKILRISGCNIQELSTWMCELTELKVLQVCECYGSKVVHPNIITSMTRLEELSLQDFTLKKPSELNCLTSLFHLGLTISNVDMLLNELSVETAQKLEEFCIGVGSTSAFLETSKRYATTLELDIKSPIDSICGVLQILLQKCENLKVNDSVGFGNLLSSPNGNYGCPRLKRLKIFNNQDFNLNMPHGTGNITPHLDLQVSFPELMDLEIQGESNLENLWHNNGLTANSFCKLQYICITNCNKLTYVFPSAMVTSLVFLNTLQVRHCELVETIFEIEEWSGDFNQVVPLKILQLHFLPNLKHVWNYDPPPELLTFPNLNKVEVKECPQLKTPFPASFINHMKEIEILDANCQNEMFPDEALQLVPPKIVLFPRLRSLEIHCKLVKRKSFWLRSDSFSNLENLYLIGSKDDGMVSFPLEMRELLYRIKVFEIRNAFGLVRVFQNGEKSNINHQSSSGAKLKSLTLENLPNLTHVWDQMTITSCFDILDYIIVNRCEKLKYLLPSSITFFNLKTLILDDCNGMMNLFTSSVVKTLVNLNRISISNCTKLSSLVATPEGEEEKGKEVIFNSMHYLELHNLPRLLSFHSGKCMLKFPCMEAFRINGCPEMKTFSYEQTSTPKLSVVWIETDDVSVSPTHGINAAIQDWWKDEIVRSIQNLFTQYQDEDDVEDDIAE